jgi:hypothetical protein
MKRLRSNARLARGKYSASTHVEQSGIGLRLLTASEIEEMQRQVDRVRSGESPRAIRLKVPA